MKEGCDMHILGRRGRFLSALAGAVATLTLVVPLTVAAPPQSATAGGYADSSTTGMGRSHSASLGLPHSARADFTKRPVAMSPAEQQALAPQLIRHSHPAPPT